METNRNTYLDFVKAILIFLVTLGHTIQIIRYQNEPAFWNDLLFKAIYIFHMPLFIAISGYFTYFSLKRHSVLSFLKNRFLYLFIPMFIWCILIFLFKSFIDRYVNWNVLFYTFELNYWFIWALLFYSAFLGLLSLLKINNIPILLVSILFITLITFEPFQFQLIKSMYPFFVIGYILAGIDLTNIIALIKRYFILIFIFIFAASLVCFILWNKNVYAYITPSSFYSIKITAFRFVASSIVSIAFMQIVYFIHNKITSNKIKTYISTIGQETLGIYLIQGFIYYIYPFIIYGINTIIYNNWLSIPMSILIVIMSHIFISLTSKNKVLGTMLFGKK